MRSIVTLCLLTLLTGCAGAAVPTEPAPADELADAARRLVDAGGFTFVLEREGPPLTLDALPGLGIAGASGTFVAPDRAEGDVAGRVGPLGASVPFVAVGADLWITNPLDGGWERFAAAEVIDLPVLLGADGLTAYLGTDVTGVVLEPIDVGSAYRGEFDTSELSAATNGVIGAGVVALRGTIDPDGVLATAVFDDPVESGVVWRFSFADPGVEAVIEPPA